MVGHYKEDLKAGQNVLGTFNKSMDTILSKLRGVKIMKNQPIVAGLRLFPSNMLTHLGYPSAFKAISMFAVVSMAVGGLHYTSSRRVKYVKDFN